MRAEFDAAERHLGRSIEIAPDFAMAYWAIGEIKRLTGDNEQAAMQEAASPKSGPPAAVDRTRQRVAAGAGIADASKNDEARELGAGATYRVVKLSWPRSICISGPSTRRNSTSRSSNSRPRRQQHRCIPAPAG